MITCPYHTGHRMPSKRLPWHLVKCKSKMDRERAGLPSFHCRNNYLHIFLKEEDLLNHEQVCGREAERAADERVEEQKEINQGLLTETAEDQDDPALKSLMTAYRADQQDNPRRRWDKDTQSQVSDEDG